MITSLYSLRVVRGGGRITFHSEEKSSFMFLENLNCINMFNMFTKNIFNVCKLPFVSM